MAVHNNITDVPGIRVGHSSDPVGLTGCTVVLAEAGAVGGVDVRGSAPGTRETDLLAPVRLVERVHAVVLSGGSAFGLDVACGVMDYLEERGVGFDAGAARVPIVPAAVLFDLNVGDPRARPDRRAGHGASRAAVAGAVPEGSVGAGTGATVGKALGVKNCMKGGLGTCSTRLENGITVGVMAVVNAFGDVVDARDGRVLAGPRDPSTGRIVPTSALLRARGEAADFEGMNTTLVVVATDARLSKEEANKVAQMAQDGLARAISPVHTMYDGDVSFTLSLGSKVGDVSVVGTVAAELVAEAVRRAVMLAEGLGGIQARRDMAD